MQRFRSCLLVVVVAIAGTNTFAQDDEEPMVAVAAMAPQAKMQLEGSVKRELQILKAITKADDATIKSLSKPLQPAIDAAAKLAGNDWMSFMMGHIPNAVLDTLETSAEKAIKDKAAFAEYREDLKTRRAFRKRISVQMFLKKLDSAVAIRSDQRQPVQKALTELAEQDHLPYGFAMGDVPLNSTVQKRLAELLTKPQLEWWKKNRKNVGQGSVAVGRSTVDMEQRKKYLQESLSSLAAAKADWLKDEFKLSDKQARKVQIAAKGAISKLIEKRLQAEDLVSESLQNGDGNLRLDSEEVMLGMVDKETLLSRYSLWRGLILKTLNDEQAARFRTLEQERVKEERENLLDQYVVSLGRGLTLTAKQLSGFRAIFDQHIPPLNPDKPTSPYVGYQKCLTLPNDVYLEVIGEANWNILKPTLQMMKQMYGGGTDADNE